MSLRRPACTCGRDGRTTRHAGLVCPIWDRGLAYRADGWHSEFRIPNSEFAYVGFARRENTTTKTHSAIKVTVPMISPGIPSKA